MNERTTFEMRLAATFQAYTDAAPMDIDPSELANQIAAARPRRAYDRITARNRWLVPALMSLLLILALAAAVVVGAQLLRNNEPVFRPLVVRPVGFMTQQRSGASAVRLADGRVLIVGGRNGYEGANTSYAEVYDPAARTFSAIGDVRPANSTGATATVLRDGRVLVAGGAGDDDRAVATARLFDPVTNSFTQLPDMTAPRVGHSAVLTSDGSVLLIGGAGFIELFEPRTGSFVRGPDIPAEPLSANGAFLVGESSVLVLPRGSPPGSGIEPYPSAFVLDVGTGSISPVSTALPADAGSAVVTGASQLGDGRVVVLTRTISASVTSSELLVYDPALRIFHHMTDLDGVAVIGPVTLADGRLLLAYQEEGCMSVAARVFNPADASIMRIGQIGGIGGCNGAPGSTVTALPDGTALIAGGNMSSGEETSSASLVHP